MLLTHCVGVVLSCVCSFCNIKSFNRALLTTGGRLVSRCGTCGNEKSHTADLYCCCVFVEETAGRDWGQTVRVRTTGISCVAVSRKPQVLHTESSGDLGDLVYLPFSSNL